MSIVRATKCCYCEEEQMKAVGQFSKGCSKLLDNANWGSLSKHKCFNLFAKNVVKMLLVRQNKGPRYWNCWSRAKSPSWSIIVNHKNGKYYLMLILFHFWHQYVDASYNLLEFFLTTGHSFRYTGKCWKLRQMEQSLRLYANPVFEWNFNRKTYRWSNGNCWI